MPTSSTTAGSPLRAALAAQTGGLAAIVLLVIALHRLAGVDPWQIPLALAMLQGALAALIARLQHAPSWWQGIHLGFAPLAVAIHRLNIAPTWFLTAFVLLLLVFWRTDKSRVPLYLTNRLTAKALTAQLPPTPSQVLDLGCGDGGLLRRLADARPDCHFVGIEHAPLPWLAARLRALGRTNMTIRHGDFWDESLAGYHLIYAFLSPAPMPRLWVKAKTEMTPNALLVSNSFAVPNVALRAIVTVGDPRDTHLYLYRIDKANDSAAFPAIPAPPDRQ